MDFNLVGNGLHRCSIRDVGGDAYRFGAHLAQFIHRLGQGIALDVEQSQFHAALGGGHGQCFANARATARDDGHFSGEVFHG